MATRQDDSSVTMTAYLHRPVGEVAHVLIHHPASAIAGTRGAGQRRVVVDLEVPIGTHGAVRRTAVVTLEPAEWQEETIRLPLSVTALDSERWFPTFSGALEADEVGHGETRLRLIGAYHLPFGAIGRASGRIGGDRSARASLYALFLSITAATERELENAAPSWRPAPMPESLRDDDSPVGA